MRKSRLVILPTKCLNQIGFLLLFLSCPVIGDWGRIQPETEASHNAIQVAREGTCGFQRDFLAGIDSTVVRYASEMVEPRREAMVPGSKRFRRQTKGRLDVRIRDAARGVERREVSPQRSRSADFEGIQVRHRTASRFASLERRERATTKIHDQTEKRQENQGFRQSQTIRVIRGRDLVRETPQTDRRMIVRKERREKSTNEGTESRRRVDEVDRRLRRQTNFGRLETRETREAERSREGTPTIRSRALEERTARTRTPERRTESPERGIRVKRMVSNDRRSFSLKIEKGIRRETVRYPTKDVPLTAGVPAEKAETLSGEELDGFFSHITRSKYNGLGVGEWSLNCLIGVVAYYFNSKQTKIA